MSDFGQLLITSGVAVLAGFAGAYLKHLLDLRSKVDEGLRATRGPLYQELWKTTELLPEWPRDEVRYGQLQDMSKQCRTWYFREGGMYLSGRSRELYSAVQDHLAPFFSVKLAPMPDAVIQDDTYDEIRAACSALRSSMTDDLLSRRGRWHLLQRLRRGFQGQSPAERRRSEKDAVERKILMWEGRGAAPQADSVH
jgi:hypothetical protein